MNRGLLDDMIIKIKINTKDVNKMMRDVEIGLDIYQQRMDFWGKRGWIWWFRP